MGLIAMAGGFIYDSYKIAPSRAPPQLVNITHLPPLTISDLFPLDVRCPAATLGCPTPNVIYPAPIIIYPTCLPTSVTSCVAL